MIEVEHRDWSASLARARELGGADLVLMSPPYPDARTDEAYGASFDTSLEGYHALGVAVFEALKVGGELPTDLRTHRAVVLRAQLSAFADYRASSTHRLTR